MPRSPSRRILIWILAVLGALLLLRHTVIPPHGWLIGRSETFVHLLLGSPSSTSPGHYGGAHPIGWNQQFKSPVKSETLRRLFLGDVYVSYEKRDGRWIVIRHQHLSPGVEF